MQDTLVSAHSYITGLSPEEIGDPMGLVPSGGAQAAGAEAYDENALLINAATILIPGRQQQAIRSATEGAKGAQYSVSFETKISKSMYPGRSDKAHFQAANEQLHKRMQADPEFSRMMEKLYPGITKGVQPGPRGAYPRRAPTKDVTWHHGVNPGQMQLVPRSQHNAPGAVQETLHPEGVGGMNTWGGGR